MNNGAKKLDRNDKCKCNHDTGDDRTGSAKYSGHQESPSETEIFQPDKFRISVSLG
jgi:hypothetical protein